MDFIGFEVKCVFLYFPFIFLIWNGSFPQLGFIEPEQVYRMKIMTLFNKIEPLDQTQ